MKTRLARSSVYVFSTGFVVGAAVVESWRMYQEPFGGTRQADRDLLEDGPSKKRGRQILKYGVPVAAPLVSYYKNHALHYDQAKKIPSWVAEQLNDWNIRGVADRHKSHFRQDPSFPDMFCSKNEDFRRSGWSRGHMAPAGDNKFDQAAMNDTFLLSNIVPQDMDNNAGFWNRFELYCRDLTKQYGDVRVISGPLILPCGEEEVKIMRDGKEQSFTQKYVKYPVVGKSEVAVPTHLFKVIVADKSDKGPSYLGAFIVPNKPISREHKLMEYKVPLEEVERRSGFELLPGLNRSNVHDLCEDGGCQLMSFEKFELYFIGRKVHSANNLNRLEKAWSELKQKKLTPDKDLVELYNKRKQELSSKESS